MKLLLALAIAAVPASDGIAAFAGGRVTSPDGKWAVWAAPADADNERAAAIARLNGPGVRNRELMRFARKIDVIWPREPGRVLIVEHTIHFSAVNAYTLAPAEDGADRIQSDLDRAMAAHLPKLGTIENRGIKFGQAGTETCVLVEESGLPPGRQTGSFLVRSGAFRLDLAKRCAVPIAECPAARID